MQHSIEGAIQNLIPKGRAPVALRELFKLLHGSELPAQVELAELSDILQEKWVPLHPSGRPLKLQEMDLPALDAGYTPQQQMKAFILLKQLGLFATASEMLHKQYDTVLLHANYLDKLFPMTRLLAQLWDGAVRPWEKIVYLSAYLPVESGEKDSVEQLRKLCEQYNEAPPEPVLEKELGFPDGYSCHVGMLAYMWHTMPMFASMREKVDLHLISAADPLDKHGHPVPANTQNALEAFHQSDAFSDFDNSYLVISCAPLTLRQHLITQEWMVLTKGTDVRMDTVGARSRSTPFLTVALRELANVYWQLKRLQRLEPNG